MQITKGQLLQILNTVDADPQFLSRIIVDMMKRLPKNYSWQLAQQLYMDYYFDGDVITVKNNITGVVRKFSGTQDIYTYLKSLGYACSPEGIRRAIKDRKDNYCNHSFTTKEKEIIYFE